MKMALGENLRKLRISENLTQEQLAEALGVSPQAVSRWENESACPDISLLPVIANFFEVSSDFLLGIDLAQKHQKIAEALKHDEKLRCSGETEKSIEFLREKTKEYPNSPELLHRMACSVLTYYHQGGKGLSEKEETELARQSVSLCKRALSCTEDPKLISRCKQTMILNYVNMGEYERAEELADDLPSFWSSREMVYPKTLPKEKRLCEYQNTLLQLADAVIMVLGRIKSCGGYTENQIINLSLLREEVIIKLLGENPCFFNERLFKLAMIRAKIYAARGETEKLKQVAEKMKMYVSNYEENNGRYEVFWLSECEDPKGEPVPEAKSLDDELREFLAENHL